ncbi:MAG: IPExxxVDY family protein [Bacteroidales bacterium]
MKKKPVRIKLEINEDDEKIFLIGIVSTEPDYRISLSLNKKLNISLKTYTPLELSHPWQPSILFSRFADFSGMPDISYTLTANKSGKNMLFKKHNRIDYFLSIIHYFPNLNTEKLLHDIRDTDGITAVFVFDCNEIDYRILQC